MKIFPALILLIFITNCICNIHNKRSKRTLIWPYGGSKVQMIVGVGLPLVLRDEAVIIGTVIKTNYRTPQNASDYLQPNIQYARKKRNTSRWTVYEALAQIATIHGFGGKECILRTVCEMAGGSISNHQGLLEEIVHTIFTPSTTFEETSNYIDNNYYAAEELGKQNSENCKHIFPECTISLLDAFTMEDPMAKN